jgi:hypothetical protein
MNGMRDGVYRCGVAMRGPQFTAGLAALRSIYALGRMETGDEYGEEVAE